MSCANTAEPIEMSFGLLTRVGPRNHTLDGGAGPPRERDNLDFEGGQNLTSTKPAYAVD